MNWYKRSAGRDRWGGGEQGDERRNSQEGFQEEVELFNQEHREELRILKDFATQGNFKGFNRYLEKLRSGGTSEKVIQRLITQAMYKVKL